MPKLFSVFTLFSLFFNFSILHAQHDEKCGHRHVTEKLYETNPDLRPENNAAYQELESFTRNYTANVDRSAAPILTIPTVVHVIHNNGPENLTDAEIIDAMALLNEDFSATNEEIPSEIHPNFQNIVANSEVVFELACLDPDGLPTNGITRKVSNYTYAGDDIQMKIETQWPQDKYMNVWLVNKPFANSSSSGFAYYPSSVEPPYEEYDGIVIAYWAFGRHDQTSVGYEHVFSHEVGHWANLKHTWGDQSDFGTAGACNDDDGVADTPNTEGHAFYGDCTLETFSCGTLDNNNNFMDYTGTCTGMFTLGQKDRMRAALNSSVGGRSNLWSAGNLAMTLCSSNAALLLYTNTSIEEDLANDGTINGVVTVAAQNVNFSQSSGNFTAGTHYTISGLPPGLSATVTVIDNTTVEIIVAGNSSPHENIDDSNWNITFTDSAFSGEVAANVIGSNYTNLTIDFLDAYRVECIDLADPHVEILGQNWEYFALNYGDAEFGTWLYGGDSIKLETYGKGAICFNGTNHIQPLVSGNLVGPSSNFTYPGPYPEQLDISNPSYTTWNGQTAYIGFEFSSLSRTHYGWLRATVTADGSKFTVTDGAYNTEPFAGIYTGDCGNGVVPQLVYNPQVVNESMSNDGIMDGSPINIILENATLSQSSGNFTEGTHYTILGLPSGLSVSIVVTSSTTMELYVTGTAAAHADVNDSNFTITFLDAAYNSELASNVLDNSNPNLLVDFLDPYGIECIDLADPYAEVGGQEWEYFTLNYGNAEYGTWLYNGDMLKLETYDKAVVCYAGTRNIRPLGGSFSVGPTSDFEVPGPYPDQLDVSNPSYTTWNGYTGYIGIRISNAGNFHYGWLYASVNASGTNFTVLDGAYNTQPNAPILTGDCTGPTFTITPTVTAPSCAGDSDGTISLSVIGGNSPYTYSWSNGSTSANQSGLSAGSYTVTVTDSNGSTSSSTVSVTDPTGMTLSTTIINESSTNTQDGAIDLTVSGGQNPYTFDWNNGSTLQDIIGLGAGTYLVTVTDSNGCTATIAATVVSPSTATYCDAVTLLDYNWITNVSFESINYTSTWGGGYEDYTSQVASVELNSTHQLTINCEIEYWPDIAVSAWIDWNQDGDFYDAGEAVYGVVSPGAYTTSVTVPATAVPGITRMRVRMGYGLGLVLDPCGTDTYQGEVEDYSINIISSCPINQTISTDYPSGVTEHRQVSNQIQANNLIKLGANIIYDAGVQVCLDPGFQVELGATFLGKIDGCQ